MKRDPDTNPADRGPDDPDPTGPAFSTTDFHRTPSDAPPQPDAYFPPPSMIAGDNGDDGGKDDLTDVDKLVDEIREMRGVPQWLTVRLASLRQDVSRGGWGNVDTFRALDPAGTAATLRDKLSADDNLASIKRLRTGLTLALIILVLLTVVGVAVAYLTGARSMPRLLSFPLPLRRIPNLVPWLRLLALGHLILVDLVIGIALILVWRRLVTRRRERQERAARDLEEKLHRLARAMARISAARTSPAAGIVQFLRVSDEMINELVANRVSIEQLEKVREKEVNYLNTFGGDLVKATSDLVQHSEEVRATFTHLTDIQNAFAQQVTKLETQQKELTGVLDSMRTEMTAFRMTNSQEIGRLETQARLFNEAADHVVNIMGSVTASLNQLKAELSGLRKQSGVEHQDYTTATVKMAQSTDALVSRLDPLSRTAQALEKIHGQLSDAASKLQGGANDIASVMTDTKQTLYRSSEALADTAKIIPTLVAALDARAQKAAQEMTPPGDDPSGDDEGRNVKRS